MFQKDDSPSRLDPDVKFTLKNFKVEIDPSLPPRTLRFVSSDGRIMAEILNLEVPNDF